MIKLADNLEVKIDFVTERNAFLARTGAGKSGGMRVMFEQFVDAGIFSVFVDPKGDAWGIRAEGLGPGKPVLVIGGDHGDIPIEPTAGKVIAEFLMRERVSCVLDISDFGTTEMWRFMADFCKIAYKVNREVCHLFIDEVDMLAGQQYYDPHCLHGIQLIQNKGRNRGWGVTIASQRPQMVNLTVLNASGTYVVMQTIGDDGLKVVRRLLGAVCSREVTTEILSQLPTLQPREAFVYSPPLLGIDPVRITFAAFQTFDSMRTPRPGEAVQKPKSLADIDLASVRADMIATIEEVKANDPDILKKRIADLEREVATAKKAAVVPPVTPTKEIQVPVIDEVALNKLRSVTVALAENMEHGVAVVLAAVQQWANEHRLDQQRRATEMLSAIEAARTIPPRNGMPSFATPVIEKDYNPNGFSQRKRPTGVVEAAAKAIVLPEPNGNGDLKLNGAQQRILNALAFYESIGNFSPSNVQIGAVAVMDATGGYFSNLVGPLSTNGLITRETGRLSLTDAGRALAHKIEVPASLSGYHDALKSRVRKMKSASGRTIDVLDVIIKAGGRELTKAQIGEQIGIDHTGGYFSNTIGPLSTAGLITNHSGVIRPTAMLFPEGLS